VFKKHKGERQRKENTDHQLFQSCYRTLEVRFYMNGPNEERVKSIFIHFRSLLPSGTLNYVFVTGQKEFGTSN
jgi:hypothetical protein